MNCPLDRTDALGFFAESVASVNPATPISAGRSGLVGSITYLTETTPTA